VHIHALRCITSVVVTKVIIIIINYNKICMFNNSVLGPGLICLSTVSSDMRCVTADTVFVGSNSKFIDAV